MIDFAHVKGQEHVKRAIEVACAGGHALLMLGETGRGKTLLLEAAAGLGLPDLCCVDELPSRVASFGREERRALNRGTLLAAMSPSPTGLKPLAEDLEARVAGFRYLRKLPVKLFDRIAMHIELESPTKDELDARRPGEPTRTIQARIQAARARQQARNGLGRFNGSLDAQETKHWCVPCRDARELLLSAVDQLALTPRGYDQVLQVALTVADLDAHVGRGTETIGVPHIAEALQYKSIDRWLFAPLFLVMPRERSRQSMLESCYAVAQAKLTDGAYGQDESDDPVKDLAFLMANELLARLGLE